MLRSVPAKLIGGNQARVEQLVRGLPPLTLGSPRRTHETAELFCKLPGMRGSAMHRIPFVITLAMAVWIDRARAADAPTPAENLPSHIRQVTHFGERADWSHDGKRILFLSKTFG